MLLGKSAAILNDLKWTICSSLEFEQCKLRKKELLPYVDEYFYFRLIAISEEQLQPYILNNNIISRGYLQWSTIFNGTVFLTNKHLQSLLPDEFTSNVTSCSHPFVECYFLYYKRVFAATHTFKFTSTCLFWDSNCSSCKGYFWNHYFLESASLTKYLL